MNLKQLKDALATIPEYCNDKEVYVTTPSTTELFAFKINKFVRSLEDQLIINCELTHTQMKNITKESKNNDRRGDPYVSPPPPPIMMW
jgi:hypothetical protein